MASSSFVPVHLRSGNSSGPFEEASRKRFGVNSEAIPRLLSISDLATAHARDPPLTVHPCVWCFPYFNWGFQTAVRRQSGARQQHPGSGPSPPDMRTILVSGPT